MSTGWEDRLLAAVEHHIARPFDWAESNCLWLMMDAAKAVSGTDPFADERGRFKSERGALQRMKARGFATLEELVASVFPRVPMAQAKRGDLALIAESSDITLSNAAFGLAGGVVMGAVIIGKGKEGQFRLRLDPAHLYFTTRR